MYVCIGACGGRVSDGEGGEAVRGQPLRRDPLLRGLEGSHRAPGGRGAEDHGGGLRVSPLPLSLSGTPPPDMQCILHYFSFIPTASTMASYYYYYYYYDI